MKGGFERWADTHEDGGVLDCSTRCDASSSAPDLSDTGGSGTPGGCECDVVQSGARAVVQVGQQFQDALGSNAPQARTRKGKGRKTRRVSAALQQLLAVQTRVLQQRNSAAAQARARLDITDQAIRELQATWELQHAALHSGRLPE